MIEKELKFNGQKLKQKRDKLNKTQAEVAKFLDITPQSYGEMERSLITPSSSNLAKICLFFHCPIHDFFDISENFLRKALAIA